MSLPTGNDPLMSPLQLANFLLNLPSTQCKFYNFSRAFCVIWKLQGEDPRHLFHQPASNFIKALKRYPLGFLLVQYSTYSQTHSKATSDLKAPPRNSVTGPTVASSPPSCSLTLLPSRLLFCRPSLLCKWLHYHCVHLRTSKGAPEGK